MTTTAPSPNPSSRRLVIIAAAVVLLLIGSAAGTFLYLRSLEQNSFEQGQTLLDSGDYAAAITAFNEAMAIRPDFVRRYDAEALAGRGLAHLGDANYQAVVDDLTAVLDTNANQADLLAARAEAYQQLGNDATAVDDYNAALKLSPDQPDWLAARAAIRLRQGDASSAMTDYDAALALDDQLIEPHLVRLRHAAALGQSATVMTEAETLLQLDDTLAEPYLYRGLVHLHYRHDAEALADLTRATELDAELAAAYTGLAQLYWQQQAYPAAREAADSALAIDEQAALALAVRGAVLVHDGDEAGLADLNTAVAIAPTDRLTAQALYYRALTHQANGHSSAALSDAEQVVTLAPDWSWGYILRGDIHLARGERPQALFDYQQAIDIDPESAVVYTARAAGYAANAELPAALADLAQALTYRPDYLPALLLRAEIAANDNPEQALADLTQALPLALDPAPIYAQRAAVYARLNQWPEARTDYEETLKTSPNDLATLIGHAQASFAQADYAIVIADLDAAISQDRQNAALFDQRAQAYLELEQLEAAFTDAQQAKILDDKLAMPYFIAGLYKLEQENYFQAVVEFSDAIDLDETLARAYAARGQAHYQLDDPDRARADAARAIELAPDLADGYLVRAQVNAYWGDWMEALDDANLAIDLAPENADTYKTRGIVYLQSGDANAALDDFNQMQKFALDLVDSWLYRAVALDELGRYGEAVASLQEALALTHNVNDVELAESSIADLERIPTAVDGYRTWQDTYHGFTITYPETWRQYVDPGEIAPLAIVGPPDKDYRANLSLLFLEFDFSPTASEFARYYEGDVSRFDGYELISDQFVQVDGRSAIRRVYSWTAPDPRLRDVEVTIIEVFVVNGQSGLIFTALMRADDLEKYEPVFNDMIDSFDFQ